jgi:hypothetical protein
MDSPVRKVRRAEQHFDALRRKMSVWKSRSVGIEIARDEGRHSLVFISKHVPEIPDEWTDDISDAMQNARNALDHIAYQLALLANGYVPLDEADRRKIQFPWSKSRDAFGELTKKNSKYFRYQDWTALEDLQLHNATSDEIWGGSNSYPLHFVPFNIGMLWKLANVDKHQEALPLWLGVGDAYEAPPEVGGCRTSGGSIFPGRLENGKPFAQWGFEDEMPQVIDLDEVGRYLPICFKVDGTYFEWPDAYPGMFFPVEDFETIIEGALRAVRTVLWMFEPALRLGEDPRTARSARQELGWL